MLGWLSEREEAKAEVSSLVVRVQAYIHAAPWAVANADQLL